MRFDEEKREINIDVHEFVTLARRCASPTPPKDEDEPTLKGIPKRTMDALSTSTEEAELEYTFCSGGLLFNLKGVAYCMTPGMITLAREVASPIGKPTKEEIAEARGEAYVTAFMLAKERGLGAIGIRIFYLGSMSDEHTEAGEIAELDKLEKFFGKCKSALEKYARPEIDRVTRRLPTLRTLKFPYKNIREGQSEFIRSAYRALARGGSLYASAPTGTGKTVSALYPALKALGDHRCTKVFYLTPKTTTAESARECLELFSKGGAIVRSIILTAKEKCCQRGGLCKRSRRDCPASSLKRISDATLALYDKEITCVTIDDVREVANEFNVCPYELSLFYSQLCDVVICDFNYLFDPSVYIKRFFTKGGDYAFLIDEAHNLGERAREMFSCEISAEEIAELADCELLGPHSVAKKLSASAKKVFENALIPLVKDELRQTKDGATLGAVSQSEIPSRLYTLFDELITVIDEEMRSTLSAKDEERDARLFALRNYNHKIKKFADTLTRFDDAYRLFVFYNDGAIRAKLYCLDTAPQIRRRLALGKGAVLFSATLSPLGYYRATLGGERTDDTLEVDSPFAPEQLSVTIMDRISTRYSEREDTLGAIVRTIAATVSAKRGNYMVFSPSFEYCEALSRAFTAKYPKIKTLVQKKNMTLKEKRDFIEEFKKDESSYLIGFCVMGGIYAEGIDLAGDSLIGTVIVGIGMPSLSYEREAIAAYYDEKYEEGKQFAYIYPGMNRVFQAAGRVIRREEDRGVIVLIDDRFDDPIYKKSLPSLWRGVKFISDPKILKETLEKFWSEG
ncbi:MAG: ATP-dependent DNA helicase [Clostridia bacterium]|nr:ATP-dependent DNA helicase [Clostridia bacterium]